MYYSCIFIVICNKNNVKYRNYWLRRNKSFCKILSCVLLIWWVKFCIYFLICIVYFVGVIWLVGF